MPAIAQRAFTEYCQTPIQILSSYTGGTPLPPAAPHHLQNQKWQLGGPKMADGVWKGLYP